MASQRAKPGQRFEFKVAETTAADERESFRTAYRFKYVA